MINWYNFNTRNLDADGLQHKFEDLCRLIFINEFIEENEQRRYLHANPNNPGLETDPIYSEKLKKWIGFQAKYFDSKVDYVQIKESAKKIIKNYTGKDGIVEHVFLYSNKSITASAKGYKSIVDMLNQHGITIELVTDNAILDCVRNKYPYLGVHFFGTLSLDFEWFTRHNEQMFDLLRERFNRQFNVDTRSSDELSLFVHDNNATAYLNAKKSQLLEQIEHFYTADTNCREYLDELKQTVSLLDNVDNDTLLNSLQWKDNVSDAVQFHIADLVAKRQQLETQLGDKEKDSDYLRTQEAQRILSDIDELDKLIEMPDTLTISRREESLLRGNLLLIPGKAGTGKTHLLAHESQILMDEKRICLLLISNIYYSAEPIKIQIMKTLGLDYTIEELIDSLEVHGEIENRIVTIFIDALNETWHYQLWESGLSSIVDKIKRSPMVRLVLSYRDECEGNLIPYSIIEQKKAGRVPFIYQNGFQDAGFDAIGEFLNHYDIPFSPLEYFGYKMTNPLFLTLYCKTYNGEDNSLPELYEQLVESVNEKLVTTYKEIPDLNAYSNRNNILMPLVMQIAAYLISHDQRFLSREELEKLTYWSVYGLKAPSLIPILENENILYRTVYNNDERFYFAYDQMNDYYCAKSIFQTPGEKESFRQIMAEMVLGIKEGVLTNHQNIELFINCCSLFADKYKEECIDIIDSIADEEDRKWIFRDYIASFQWRKNIYLPFEQFVKLLNTYNWTPSTLWAMLIGNSVRISHPFNADFWHQMLSKWELNKRDYLWTTHINGLPANDNDRIVQLITLYAQGDKLDIHNEKQIELLLTLFGWLLTSSNRWLRDNTSKAMIEILKEHFSLCQVILEKFSSVNDPYVVQRIYGIVFGACCKRRKTENAIYQTLAEYVYQTVFNQESVYPDILMRDYARLVIERFLFETPDYSGVIERSRIVPPYASEPIPEIEDQHYFEQEYTGASRSIISSICFDGVKCGGYGDFGRYVFQSALRSFEINEEEILNYSLYYIFNILGYSEKLFGDYDRFCNHYDRHQTIKTERIGKKYQWITMYNILARVADHCTMKNGCYPPPEEPIHYEGPWEPYVRDFDPTLNQTFVKCANAPIFHPLAEFAKECSLSNKIANVSDKDKQFAWIEERGYLLENLKSTLLLSDDNGTQWVYLKRYCGTNHGDITTDKLHVWSWLYAFFMKSEQLKIIQQYADKGSTLITSEIAFHHETYTLYNREYPWSPSCYEYVQNAWVECEINTGVYIDSSETLPDIDSSILEKLLREYEITITDEDEDDTSIILELGDTAETGNVEEMQQDSIRNRISPREETVNIGKILYATSDLSWEEQYDASKSETISISHPCHELIENRNLRQLEEDGFYYDENGVLAAFDTNLTQKEIGVVIRKDILDAFLSINQYKLVWFVDAEREVHADGFMTTMWSDWEALFVYENGDINGEIHKKGTHIS